MIKTISMDELYTKFKGLTKDDLILDVRTPEEFSEGHVPGSRNITHTDVTAHAKELAPYKNIYVYCRSGGRVQMACSELALSGLTNLSGVVSGGMPDWEASGYPVEPQPT